MMKKRLLQYSFVLLLCCIILILPASSAPAPIITGITPSIGATSTTVQITNLSGNNFVTGATVQLIKSGISNPTHVGSITNKSSEVLLGGPSSVFISGNYAYVASFKSNALEILDISDPVHPVHMGSIVNGTGDALLLGAESVYVSGNYAYVASENSNALEIIDVSNTSLPVHKSSIINGAGGASLVSPVGVFISGNYAYVTSSNGNALEIIDISNPSSPAHAGKISISSYPYRVYVSGNYAYVANNLGNSLEIIDVTNPAAPLHKGRITNGNGGALLYGPWDVYVNGNYAYVVGLSNALEIVDVSNPAAPVHKGSIINGTGGALLEDPAGVVVSGNYAYVTSQNSNAFEIIDVSNPANPVHKGIITNGTGGALLLNPWGVYVSGNNAYIASFYSNALEIVNLGFIPATGVSVVNPTKISCFFDLTGIPTGQYDVIVTNPDRQQRILVNGFTVTTSSSKIGIFRNSTHLFYLDYNGNGAWNGASIDRQYIFGLTGDIPVTGDWNKDNKTEIGVFRPSTHTFYLDYNGNGAWNGASVDRQYNFGLNGDTPISGDWDNNGKYEIGVFRNSTHTFYLDYSGNGVWNGALIDRQYTFGISGDSPVFGDWNNDGFTEIGVFRNSTHQFYLDYNWNGAMNGASADRQYNFGISGDIPVSGDWNNDGKTEIGVFRNSTHLFYLDYNGNGVWNGAVVDRTYNFGITGDMPISGDWM